jgi:hypothetical protein
MSGPECSCLKVYQASTTVLPSFAKRPDESRNSHQEQLEVQLKELLTLRQ